jgi:hypothetical protein
MASDLVLETTAVFVRLGMPAALPLLARQLCVAVSAYSRREYWAAAAAAGPPAGEELLRCWKVPAAEHEPGGMVGGQGLVGKACIARASQGLSRSGQR